LLEPFHDLIIKFNVAPQPFEIPHSIQNHVTAFHSYIFIKQFHKNGPFTIRKDITPHMHRTNLSATDTIKYDSICNRYSRVGASEGEAKNSTRRKTEEEKTHGNN